VFILAATKNLSNTFSFNKEVENEYEVTTELKLNNNSHTMSHGFEYEPINGITYAAKPDYRQRAARLESNKRSAQIQILAHPHQVRFGLNPI